MPTKKRQLQELKKAGDGNKQKLTDFFSVNNNRNLQVGLPVPSTSEANETNENASTPDPEPEDILPTPKRRKKSSGHKTGYNTEWVKLFPWLLLSSAEDEDGQIIDVVLCSICKNNQSGNIPDKTWTETGYRLLRQDKLRCHEGSEQHKLSLSIELNKNTSKLDDVCHNIETKAKLAVQDAFKVLFFIIQNNLSLDLFASMTDLCIEVGATDLPQLRLAKNASYTSWDIVNELVTILGELVEEDVISEIKRSPTFSCMADEVADITSIKHLAISIRYILEGKVHVAFLSDTELKDGTAEQIKMSIEKVFQEKGLSITDMSGFASDGAAVFMGKKNGVTQKLKDMNPGLIAIHCKDHRLALACRDSFGGIPEFKKLDEILETLYKYYKYSCKKTASLKSVQKAFDDVPLNIKQAKHHRWLSHNAAVSSIVKSYKCIIVDLETSSVSKDPVGHGLLKELKKPQVCLCLLLLADTLPNIANLSLFFQRRDTNLGMMKATVDKTLKLLETRKSRDGPWLIKQNEIMQEAGIENTVDIVHKFNKEVRSKFIDELITNINERFSDSDIVENLSILDLSANELHSLPPLYGLNELTNLACHFQVCEEDLLLQWQDFLELLKSAGSFDLCRDLNGLLQLFFSPQHITKNFKAQYPLVSKLIAIAGCLPLSSAEVERVFSQLKLTKTDHRNRLQNKKLEKLLNIKINCSKERFNSLLSAAVNKFFMIKNRRIM